jgi:hypothetical protein
MLRLHEASNQVETETPWGLRIVFQQFVQDGLWHADRFTEGNKCLEEKFNANM